MRTDEPSVRVGPLAPRDAWPPVLRDQPWRGARRAEPAVLALAPIATPCRHPFTREVLADRYRLDPGRDPEILADMAELGARVAEIEAAAARLAAGPPRPEPVPTAGDDPGRALAWLERRLRGDGQSWGWLPYRYWRMIGCLTHQPEPLALMLWSQTDLLLGLDPAKALTASFLLIRFGEAAVTGLAAIVVADPRWVTLAADVDAAGLAPAMARLLRHRTARLPASRWLRRHPRTAAMRLLPDALGPSGPARDDAATALRWLAAAVPESRAALDAAAAAYAALDPRVSAAVAAGIDGDPLARVPARVARPPAWAAPGALPRPRLLGGGALPDEAVAAIVEMLSFSAPFAPYAGLAALRACCTADSLDAFALDLTEAWAAAGLVPRRDWALWAQAWLGGERCARDLPRRIRAWATEGRRASALAGLDVLAAIGTDAALAGLAAIAAKNPFAALRERAAALLADAAAARGLSAEEMADRAVPDLGLDGRGGLDLDFGPRRFRVGFDEMLRPWVRDAAGARLRALPRPDKRDDRALAGTAAARWAGLKADAAATARLQVSRLEAMLAGQRRVTPAVFRRFFAHHPLMRHLAGRLVWGLYARDGAAVEPDATFRVAEDLALADADDRPVALDAAEDAAGRVGLVHPLHLGPDLLGRWVALFGDFEIAQPFPQIGREVFRLAAAEAAGAEIGRFAGLEVAGRRLRGMRAQGWPLEEQGGTFEALCRGMSGADGRALAAALPFEPGLDRTPPEEGDAPQVLGIMTLADFGVPRGARPPRFGDLDPVAASEMLRGPSLLAAAGRG